MSEKGRSGFEEVQFWELPKAAHVFNTCQFEYCGLERLLIASRNHLLSLGAEWGKFSLQEIPLLGVPDDAEILSIGGFVAQVSNSPYGVYSDEASHAEDKPVIAVAFQRDTSSSPLLHLASPPMTPSSMISSSAPAFSFSSSSRNAAKVNPFNLASSSSSQSSSLTPNNAPSSGASHFGPFPPQVDVGTTSTGSLAMHRRASVESSSSAEQQGKCFLHVYTSLNQAVQDASDLGCVTQTSAQTMELNYIPMSLGHAALPVPFKVNTSDRYLTVAGGDNKMHFYRQRKRPFSDMSKGDFPEFDESLFATAPHRAPLESEHEASKNSTPSPEPPVSQNNTNAPSFVSFGSEVSQHSSSNDSSGASTSSTSSSASSQEGDKDENRSSASSSSSSASSSSSSPSSFSESIAMGGSSDDGGIGDQDNDVEYDSEYDNHEGEPGGDVEGMRYGDQTFQTGLESRNQSRHDRTAGASNLLFEMEQPRSVPLDGLDDLSAPILAFKVQPLDFSRSNQFLAVGCEDGMLRVVGKHLDRHGINDSCFTAKFEGPLSCVDFVETSTSVEAVDVVVGGSMGFAAVLECSLRSGEGSLSEPRVLPTSTEHDSVLCCKVADVDWDGKEEVLIGTYGQQLLAYSVLEEGQGLSEDVSCDSDQRSSSYVKSWERQFAYPIFSIEVGDFNQDGADELVVNTLKGVHILQPDLELAAQAIQLSLQQLEELQDLAFASSSSNE